MKKIETDDLPEADALNGAPHPRQVYSLVGHERAEAEMLSAYREGRLAQRLGARRPSRLARPNDGKPERGEALLEPLGLDRLPGALPAFERDEAGPCLLGHCRVGRRDAASVSISIQ